MLVGVGIRRRRGNVEKADSRLDRRAVVASRDAGIELQVFGSGWLSKNLLIEVVGQIFLTLAFLTKANGARVEGLLAADCRGEGVSYLAFQTISPVGLAFT